MFNEALMTLRNRFIKNREQEIEKNVKSHIPLVRHMRLLTKEQVSGLERSINRVGQVVCDINKPDPKHPSTKNVIFVMDHLVIDSHGDLLGRLRPAGPHRAQAVELLMDDNMHKKVIFHPVTSTSDRNWKDLTGLYLTYV